MFFFLENSLCHSRQYLRWALQVADLLRHARGKIHTMSTRFSSQCHSVLLCFVGSLSCRTHDRGHRNACSESMHTSPYARKERLTPYVFCTHTPLNFSLSFPVHSPTLCDRLFFSISRAVVAIEQVCQCRACPTMGSTGHQRTSCQTFSNPNFRAWWLSRLQKPFKPWTGTTQAMKIRKSSWIGHLWKKLSRSISEAAATSSTKWWDIWLRLSVRHLELVWKPESQCKELDRQVRKSFFRT